MKHSRAFTVLLLCLSLSPAMASEFDEYRIPESSWRRYSMSIAGFGQRSSDNPTGSYSRSLAGRANIDVGFSIGRDSDPLRWDATTRGSLRGSHTGETRGGYGPPIGAPGTIEWESIRSRSRDLDENWSLDGGVRWYPGASRIGFQARGSVYGQERQSWNGEDSKSRSTGGAGDFRWESQGSNVQWTYREAADLTAGVGVGRVRDATPVFLAILLEERLQRDGKLQRALTRSCRQRLAELFTLRADFSRVHALPEKFFWSEVERLLREDGALVADGLDAFAAQHVDEDLAVARSAFVRQAGWFVGPSLSARHSHNLIRTDIAASSLFDDGVSPPTSSSSRGGSRLTSSTEALMAGGNAEYYRPLGPRMQASVSVTALAGVTGDEDLMVQGSARLQRLVGERWLAEAYAFNTRSIRDDTSQHAYWTVLTGGAISYFLEDYCRAELALDRDEGLGEYAQPGPARRHVNNLTVRLSLNFGRGRLDAPGLMAPVRPMN